MALDHKSLEQLVEADLVDLVDNAVSEGTSVDYKTELPSNGDEDKREFLRDVSSFANTAGGHIVYGMTEEGGIATGVPGVEILDVEAEKLRLENVLRDALAPRLPQYGLYSVALENGRRALVLRIARSWLRPHMVTFRGLSEFWARNSTGKYKLDVDQIRGAMLSAPTASERIRRFRNERTTDVLAGQVPRPLRDGPKTILQLVPLDAFDNARPLLDLTAFKDDPRLIPLYADQARVVWNLDGLYGDDHWNADATSTIQLHRTGIVEAVDQGLLSLGSFSDGVFGHPFEQRLIDRIAVYLGLQQDVGAALPVVVLVTLTGLRNYWVVPGNPRNVTIEAYDRQQFGGGPSFDRDLITLPDVLIDAWDADLPAVMRPVFDAFWQASGKDGSPNYGPEGVWQQQ